MKNLSIALPFERVVALGLLTSTTLLLACNSSALWEDPNLDIKIEKGVFSKHAVGLTVSPNCDAYKAYLIKTKAMQYASRQYYRYPEFGVPELDGGPQPNDSAVSDEAGEFTTTNLQESGVDEMDILKNDGAHMYVIEQDGIRVLKSWPASELKELTKISFPKDDDVNSSNGQGLLLIGKRLIAFRTSYQGYDGFFPGMGMGMPFYYRGKTSFHVDVYDVNKPDAPVLMQTSQFDGDFNTARSIDGRIYVVMNSQLNTGYFDKLLQDEAFNDVLPMPNKDIWNMDEKERQAYIDKAVPIINSYLTEKSADLKLDALMPIYKQQKGSAKKELALLSCQDIYLPKTASQNPGLMSILELSGDDFSQVRASAIADSTWLVYASSENIYAVASSYNWFWSCYSEDACKSYSHIHRFNYKGQDGHIQYINSGEIEGIVNDSFWMSEHKGYLRVATQDQSWGNDNGSSLSILDLNGAAIKQVGRIDGIAPGERIFASRMFGDKGYLVTFKQTDPLFTLDLSEPKAPKIMGELKINGYSSYIHPLGENALLTIGKDADDNGRETGLQLQIFDVSDMKNPKRSHQYLIATDGDGSYSSSAALYNHHAFSFHAPSGLLAIPMNVYKWSHWMAGSNFSGMIILKASADKGFQELGLIDHAGFKKDPNAWWDELRRSRFMFKDAGVYDKNAYVYTLSGQGMKVSNANQPSQEVAKVGF